eukprot:gene8205-5730_t
MAEGEGDRSVPCGDSTLAAFNRKHEKKKKKERRRTTTITTTTTTNSHSINICFSFFEVLFSPFGFVLWKIILKEEQQQKKKKKKEQLTVCVPIRFMRDVCAINHIRHTNTTKLHDLTNQPTSQSGGTTVTASPPTSGKMSFSIGHMLASFCTQSPLRILAVRDVDLLGARPLALITLLLRWNTGTMLTCDNAAYQRDFEAQKTSGPVTFTPQHREKNMEVYKKVKDLLPFNDIYRVSDCDLVYRFLIGKHWSVEQAAEAIREYIELRQKESINEILGTTSEPEAQSVVAEIYGEDLDGHPVLWFRPDPTLIFAAMKKFDKNENELTRANLRQMEQARFCSLAVGKDRCTYVMDLEKISMTTITKSTVDFVRDLTKVLQRYYPEIMHRLIVCNAGWAVNTGWKMLQPFVDTRIQDKLKFYNKAPSVEYLAPFISQDNVHPRYGGTGKTDKMKQLLDEEFQRVVAAAKDGAPATAPPCAKHAVAPPMATPSVDADADATAARSPSVGDQAEDVDTLYSFTDSFRYHLAIRIPHTSVEEEEEDAAKRGADGPNPVLQRSFSPLSDESSAAPPLEHIIICNPAAERKARSASLNPRHHQDPTGSPLLPQSSSAPQYNLQQVVLQTGPEAGDLETYAPSARPSIHWRRLPTVGGIYAGKQRSRRISSFEWCVQLTLTYSSSGEIICHYKGRRCASLFKSRVYATFPMQGVDNDDQDGIGAMAANFSPPTSPNRRPSGISAPQQGWDPDAATVAEEQRSSTFLDPSERVVLLQRRTRTSVLPAVWGDHHARSLTTGAGFKHSSVLCGEVLHESGHYLHTTLLVCDGERRVNFLLQRSRLRNRITVYMIVGCNREVHTTADELHYFLTDTTAPPAQRTSSTKKSPPSTVAISGPTSMAEQCGKSLEELRREAIHIGTVMPPATQSKPDPDWWVMFGAPKLVYHDKDAAGGTQGCVERRSRKEDRSVVLAEHKQQLLLFYGDLAYWYRPHDLFALGAAITRLWTMK